MYTAVLIYAIKLNNKPRVVIIKIRRYDKKNKKSRHTETGERQLINTLK
jgi:hypothetical protein